VNGDRVRQALRILAVIFALGYPLGVYLGLTRFGTRGAAWVLLGLAIGNSAYRSHQLRRPAWSSALAIPLCIGALWLDDRRYVLAVPVLINAALFVTFAGSLRTDRPLVERFARMRVPDLGMAEISYCRSVTKVWSAFFLVNGAIAALLAAMGALKAWTLYTGLLSYLLIGLLGASEYTVRKYRFGRYGSGWHDRMLQALLPARSTPP
jgi:uncharacterized membrane protein